MSQYTVEHRPITVADVYKAADILWSENPVVRGAHPFERYRGLLINEVRGEQGLVCTYKGHLVGALVIGDLDYDSHFPGTGIIVYYQTISMFHPQATRLLYRSLAHLVKDGGGSWYQTTRRVSESEFTSKFRRIHG